MARKRLFDPKFWDNPELGCLGSDARLLAIGLISHADDLGHLSADPRVLRKQVFGLDDGVTIEQVAGWLASIAAAWDGVRLYAVQGKAYVELVGWSDYQDLRYTGKPQFPAPEAGEYLPDPASPTSVAVDVLPETRQEPGKNPTPGVGVGVGRVGLEEGKKNQRPFTPAPKPGSNGKGPGKPVPVSGHSWPLFGEAVSGHYGGARVVAARTGKPLAWFGELCGVAGKQTGGDEAKAVALWNEYHASPEWQFRPRDPSKGALTAAFGAWCVDRKPKEPPPNNGWPESWSTKQARLKAEAVAAEGTGT